MKFILVLTLLLATPLCAQESTARQRALERRQQAKQPVVTHTQATAAVDKPLKVILSQSVQGKSAAKVGIDGKPLEVVKAEPPACTATQVGPPWRRTAKDLAYRDGKLSVTPTTPGRLRIRLNCVDADKRATVQIVTVNTQGRGER